MVEGGKSFGAAEVQQRLGPARPKVVPEGGRVLVQLKYRKSWAQLGQKSYLAYTREKYMVGPPPKIYLCGPLSPYPLITLSPYHSTPLPP